MWIYLNDRFVPQEEAKVSVFDHGFLYGDGIYETLRAYDRRMFMLSAHLARLKRSASLIGLTLPVDDQAWPPLLREAMDRNNLRDAYLRVTVSRGEGAIGLDPALCPKPTLVVIAKPLPVYPPHLFAEGVSLAIVRTRRNLDAALSPQIKSLNFLNNILAKREVTQRGAFDAVMLNFEGHVTEGTMCNLFWVREGRLYTPAVACGILDGITREIVLALAGEQRIPAEEGAYAPAELLRADECFLTNTTMEIMPVRTIDDCVMGAGAPGPMTTTLRKLFQDNIPRFLDR
jgi:branched-chain amino acid aminotransferase